MTLPALRHVNNAARVIISLSHTGRRFCYHAISTVSVAAVPDSLLANCARDSHTCAHDSHMTVTLVHVTVT